MATASFGGFCPVELYCLNIQGMYAFLEERPAGSVLVLVADRGLLDAVALSDMPARLAKKYDLVWVDAVTPNPTQKDILAGLAAIGRRTPLEIIAVGGGSALDTAKGISAAWYLFKDAQPAMEDITAMIKGRSYARNPAPIPLTAIPTTAGTGSEVTKWATIWDAHKTAKFSIDDVMYYPKNALIVPELTYGAPPKLLLSTGVDALSHAMEAFWARPSNPVVKEVAGTAISRIARHLPKALANPKDPVARTGMSTAATLAGIAFSNTRTTACHSISYPMTMLFGVDHGFACALTLVEVAKINRGAVPEVDEMLREIFGGLEGFAAWLTQVTQDIQPLKLSAFGIGADDIDALVKAAFTAGRMDNNPVDLTPEQVKRILLAVC